jgi:hypothetical protein
MKFKLKVATISFLAFVSSAHAQTLGEIAKKTQSEQAARQTDGQTKPPTKKYSNENLSSDPTAPAVPAVKPSNDERTTTDSSLEKAKGDAAVPTKDEAYWRARWTPLYRKIADELAKSVEMRKRIYELTVDLSGIGPLNARRGGVEAERQRLMTEADALDNIVARDKAEFEAIREEGRRAGALPGWFR